MGGPWLRTDWLTFTPKDVNASATLYCMIFAQNSLAWGLSAMNKLYKGQEGHEEEAALLYHMCNRSQIQDDQLSMMRHAHRPNEGHHKRDKVYSWYLNHWQVKYREQVAMQYKIKDHALQKYWAYVVLETWIKWWHLLTHGKRLGLIMHISER